VNLCVRHLGLDIPNGLEGFEFVSGSHIDFGPLCGKTHNCRFASKYGVNNISIYPTSTQLYRDDGLANLHAVITPGYKVYLAGKIRKNGRQS
jgi:hypothetical protein